MKKKPLVVGSLVIYSALLCSDFNALAAKKDKFGNLRAEKGADVVAFTDELGGNIFVETRLWQTDGYETDNFLTSSGQIILEMFYNYTFALPIAEGEWSLESCYQ